MSPASTTPLHPALTEMEAAAIERLAADRRLAVRPKMRIAFNDTTEGNQQVRTIAVDVERGDKEAAWRLLEASLGTSDHEFAALMMAGLASISTQGRSADTDTKSLNGYLGIVQNIAPTDAVETMLAVQMAAIHGATMHLASNLRDQTRTMDAEQVERSMNRCARTFAAQVDALKRYRSKGDQKVTVTHVHVDQGGQAMVGTFNQAGSSPAPAEELCDDGTNLLRLPERAAVLGSLEADRLPMQGASGGGLERVPFPRRERRSAVRAS